MNEHERQAAARELYDRLRSIARMRMAGQHVGHTLDPTGLAHEAVIRLLKFDPAGIRDDDHFLALAAEAMRQILVDHARAKSTAKRGGGVARTGDPDQSPSGWPSASPGDVLAAHEALLRLEREDPEAADFVKLGLFAGLPTDEIAALKGVSRRTVERRLRFALASMRLTSHPETGSGEAS